jgi:hypothetical protein
MPQLGTGLVGVAGAAKRKTKIRLNYYSEYIKRGIIGPAFFMSKLHITADMSDSVK